MNRIPYVYELIDTETGKYYIGSNYGKGCCPEWLGVKYFTHSKSVEPLFKNNPERFSKRVLLIGSIEYVVEMESALLKKMDAKNDPDSYNGHNGDGKMNCSKFGTIGGKIGGASNAKNKTGFCGRSPEKMSEDGKKAGKVAGKLNVEKEGFMESIRTKESCTKGGKVAGRLAKENRIGFCGMTKDQRSANGNKAAITNKKNKTGIFSFTKEELSNNGKRGAELTKSCLLENYICLECGYKNNAGNVGKHQRLTGHVRKEKSA